MAKKSDKSDTELETDADVDRVEDDASAVDATPDADGADHTDGADLEPNDTAEGASVVDPEIEGDETSSTEDSEPTVPDEPKAEDATVPGALPATGEQKSEPSTVAATPPPQSAGPGVFPLLIGGVLAGAIGFGAAWLLPQDEDAASDLESRLAEIEADVSAISAPEAFDPSAIEARQDEFGTRAAALEDNVAQSISGIEAQIEEMTARLERLEARPVFEAGDTEAAMNEQIAAFEQVVAEAGADARAELDALRADAEAMRAEAEAMQQEAIAATETADLRSAMASIQAAIDSGAPYEDALVKLEDAPEGLAKYAQTGVPTMAELRTAFPAAARAALDAAEPDAAVEEEGTGVARVTSFLRRQTNARSLAPREGSDTDAILSRAEAALNSGDLDQTLSELDALSEDAQSAMTDWLSQARSRAEAVAASQELIEG